MIENSEQKIIPVDIELEMKKSYIDYAMSVIAGRALPDVRDGLKPVHRRILFSMSELNLYPDKPFRKSARIVGDVLGKYHPHGDSAVYESMVRMAQNFALRYMLVNGHGNFGSIDGDGAAAMRYTEAKMQKITIHLLSDIEKNTVDFIENFDGTEKEPSVLPARYPNLLVNGSSGIAVGMATNIPPHNLGEVIDAVVATIDNPEITFDQLNELMTGPDFPTGGIILGKEGIRSAYKTGRGKVLVRAKVTIEEYANSKQRIIVTEIPYQVNKARLVENIARLVLDKKIEGISDLRDESDRSGMRIVIELKRDVNANVILNQLYKHTQMQDTFSIIMLALVENEPKVLNLKQIIHYYLKHQKQVIVRRTQFELDKAQARAHILEGLKIALDNIDEIIKIIRASYNDAEIKLMERFGLSEIQAKAIVDLRLRRLQGLEREKIENEYQDLLIKIKYYKEILGDEALVFRIIKEEMLEIKNKFNDERRTEITFAQGDIDYEDLIDEEKNVITLTQYGYIKRLSVDTYTSQKRGGKGITGLSTREEDFIKDIFVTSTHDYIMFFTNKGRVYRIKAYEIPESGRQAKGTAIVNLLQLNPDEKIATVIPIRQYEEGQYLIMSTKNGIIKKTDILKYQKIRVGGLAAINLDDDDELIDTVLTNGDSEVILVTRKGMSIRFKEEDVRPIGRTSRGVKGIKLKKNDNVMSMEIAHDENAEILIVSEHGFGKRTSLDEYRIQTRGGTGVKTYKITQKTGDVVGMKIVDNSDDIVLINSDGTVIRLNCCGISTSGRSTQGVTLMKMNNETKVVAIAKINEKENEESSKKIEDNNDSLTESEE